MDKTFYEILGLSSDASTSDISKAFRKLVQENHPDTFESREEKDKAEHFLKEVTEAYNTLRRPNLKREYDKSLETGQTPDAQKSPQEQAKQFLAQGKRALLTGDLTGSLALFDHVLRLIPDHAEALFHAGMIRLKNPRWRNEGTRQVEEAIQKDPYTAKYPCEYASFLLESGQKLRARRILTEAVNSHPGEEEIQFLLSQCGDTGEKSAGFGLFGKKKQ